MTRTAAFFTVVFAVLLLIPSFASAQAPKPDGRRVVTTTRLVALFSDLEQQWTQAMQRRDAAPLNKFLSDEFELWTPAPPGDPVSREDWLHDTLTASHLQSFQIQQMAVRMVDDTAIVSFVQRQKADANGQDRSGDYFIVDLWTQHGDTWQVLVRYASPIKNPPQPSPSPTGKQ